MKPYRNNPTQLSTIASTYIKIRRKQLAYSLNNSRLMSLTICLFLLAYLVGGFLIFKQALFYIENLPGLGPILSERLFYLLFFFIFMMLIFSNSIILYSSLYRSKEIQWLTALPIHTKNLFTWKFFETFIFSSWGFYIVSAPLILALGNIKGASLDFYFGSFLAAAFFVIIPASIAAWLVVITVRFFNKYWTLAILSLLILGSFLIATALTAPSKEITTANGSIVSTVNQILRHTELSIHPLIPSTWLSNSVIGWSKPFQGNSFNYFLLIISYSFLGIIIINKTLWKIVLPSYFVSLKRRAISSNKRKKRKEKQGMLLIYPNHKFSTKIKEWLFRRYILALIGKDFKTLIRDPSQWIQISLVYGLLFLYVINIRNMGYQYQSEFWPSVISLMNLGVCSLSLSTLTTRFVFPQFSLEGRRLWLLSMSPISMKKIVTQKLISSSLITGTLTSALILISSSLLKMPTLKIISDVTIIFMITFALNSIALSLGTIFPNLREENSAKVVSGFGGTLCLILSFVYIITIMTLLSYPVAVKFIGSGLFSIQTFSQATITTTLITSILTMFICIIAIKLAFKKANDIRHLRNT